MVKDPVCGMEVDEKKAVASLVYGDKTYYFCAQACKRAFEKEVTGRSAMSHPREADLVFLIADLAGYTALTEAMGDMEAATVIARYVELAHDVLRPGTRLVERVGDELLIVGDEVPSTLRTARDLHAAVECEPLFPEVRAGLHAGRVLDYDGKYIGAALNLTARVTSYATPGQILCTEAVATQAEGLGDIKCRDVGLIRFRNIVEPVRVFKVIVAPGCGQTIVVDPICRVHVTPETAPARQQLGDTTFYFCSIGCARAFAERPHVYVGDEGGR